MFLSSVRHDIFTLVKVEFTLAATVRAAGGSAKKFEGGFSLETEKIQYAFGRASRPFHDVKRLRKLEGGRGQG
jgi:hypothetical protein